MLAGRLKYRLQIQQPVTEKDSFGAENTTYTPTRIVHAERVRFSGRRVNSSGELFVEYAAEWIIRNQHPIGEGWRVQEIGGLLYEVMSIEPNIDRGYNLLKCERVNE